MNEKAKKITLWILMIISCVTLSILYISTDLPVIVIGGPMEGF